MTKVLARNALIAALYASIGLLLPATALANYRLATALYAVAAWNPALIPGLALGNAISGLPQGPVDMLMGGLVGLLTAWACAKLGSRWAWASVLVIPTLLVPLWLSLLFHAPYAVVAASVVKGQAASAVLGWVLLRSRPLQNIISQ